MASALVVVVAVGLFSLPDRATAAPPAVAGAFVSLDPARLLDTRVSGGAVAGYGTVELQVAGRGGVPSSGVSAVVMNVTVTGPAAAGFVTVYPSGTPQPTASNLNFSAGQSIPNLVTVKVGADGRVNLTNNSERTTHLIADVAGYYIGGDSTSAGSFVSLEPARLLDSRTGNGTGGVVPAYGTVDLQVAGRGGVPDSGVSAVVVNVTVTGPAASGFVTVYPSGTSQPSASNLNFTAHQTIPNLVTVKLGADGRINLTNNSASGAHLLADVAGYYLSGTPTDPGTFVSMNPSRVLDTRTATGAGGPLYPSATIGLQIAGAGGVPSSGVAAVVANFTITGPQASGFVTVYPSGALQPTASNLNFTTGQNIPNLVAVKVGADGKIAPTNNSGGYTHLIADVAGYFLGDPATPSYDAAALQIAKGMQTPSAPSAANTLDQLAVAAPGSMAGYTRAQFPHWRDATNNGWPAIPVATCDGRQATLYRDGTGVLYDGPCTIYAGTWLDPYTAAALYSPSDVDIDHVVPLANAWRSGASSWTTAQRTQYANDQLVLLASDDAANQAKGDKGPEAWKPANAAAHCLYAKRWLLVKSKYALSVNSDEKLALNQMLSTCQS